MRYIIFCLIVILILFGFGMRFYCPSADPPHWLYVYNTDEGHYSYNAHNKLKYGQWFVNEAKYSLITPLFSFIQYLVAATLDGHENIIRYRAVSILCGIFSCILMAFFFREKWLQTAAVVISAMSFMGIVHSRIGIPEMMLALFFQITVLLAWQGYKKNNLILSYFSGLVAVGSIAVKTTGILIVPVILCAPLLHLSDRGCYRKYWINLISGVICGLIIWAILVIIPNWASWNHMQYMATLYGRSSISFEPFLLMRSIINFILSPALQTIPVLWPMAICWCFFIFIPQVRRQSNSFLDTLICLWIFFGVAILALPLYQPARWQLLIFPPLIYSGLRFIQLNKSNKIMTFTFLFAILLSILSAKFFSKDFLNVTGHINPGNGIFSHIILLVMAVSVVIITYFSAKKFYKKQGHVITLTIIVLNLVIQFQLHAAYMFPSYFRKSQWNSISGYLEQISVTGNALFSGDLVQDLALHSDIHVLPTFYLLENENDLFLKQFYKGIDKIPTHFIVIDIKRNRLWAEAPNFMKSLKEIHHCPLLIGGLGLRHIFIYRFMSYQWLDSIKKKE